MFQGGGMKIVGSMLVSAAFCSLATAGVRSGKAEAAWISASSSYEPGKPVQMAIRLVIDPGWHSYWLNPGEAGMKTSVKWELPAGWQAGELENPVPVRFMGAGAAGFGYKGTVVFPVKLTAPPRFEGVASLKAKVSWLTCDDQACVPGNAELTMALSEGKPVRSPDAGLIEAALAKVPRVSEDWGPLEVIENGSALSLRILTSGKPQPDLTGFDVFPMTPGIIGSNTEIEFTREGPAWIAGVPKSEYAPTPVRELALVLVPKADGPPVLLDWKIR